MDSLSSNKLSSGECKSLLIAARTTLNYYLKGENVPPFDENELTPTLSQDGASFVTLTENGQLRGCIGTLEPYRPLVEDVIENAIAAATKDYRFPPVRPEELVHISIEISYLTRPQVMNYEDSDDLLRKLRPEIDGVVIRDGMRRATFLPQVWDKLPNPSEFLNHLCLKMGVPANTWQNKKLEVSIYQVQEFQE